LAETKRPGAGKKVALECVYALPFGSLTKVQAVRANVKGFAPARIPRLSNVWFE
jgi:peptide/nickel transport system substrate-binding protein